MLNQRSTQSGIQETCFLPVILTLVDGESLKGAIAVRKNSRLGDLLNGSDRFVLFKANNGEPIYMAISKIAAVQSNEKPRANQLESSLQQMRDVNPYAILKVEPGIDKAALRNAYHQLVKHYHPDQFNNVALPREVATYLDTMVQRLNAAYQDILEDIERLEHLRKMKEAAPQTAQDDDGSIRYFGQ